VDERDLRETRVPCFYTNWGVTVQYGAHMDAGDDQTGMRDGYHKSVVIEKQVPQVPQCGTKCGTMCGALKKIYPIFSFSIDVSGG
jgi:hypothetical protein